MCLLIFLIFYDITPPLIFTVSLKLFSVLLKNLLPSDHDLEFPTHSNRFVFPLSVSLPLSVSVSSKEHLGKRVGSGGVAEFKRFFLTSATRIGGNPVDNLPLFINVL